MRYYEILFLALIFISSCSKSEPKSELLQNSISIHQKSLEADLNHLNHELEATISEKKKRFAANEKISPHLLSLVDSVSLKTSNVIKTLTGLEKEIKTAEKFKFNEETGYFEGNDLIRSCTRYWRMDSVFDPQFRGLRLRAVWLKRTLNDYVFYLQLMLYEAGIAKGWRLLPIALDANDNPSIGHEDDKDLFWEELHFTWISPQESLTFLEYLKLKVLQSENEFIDRLRDI